MVRDCACQTLIYENNFEPTRVPLCLSQQFYGCFMSWYVCWVVEPTHTRLVSDHIPHNWAKVQFQISKAIAEESHGSQALSFDSTYMGKKK